MFVAMMVFFQFKGDLAGAWAMRSMANLLRDQKCKSIDTSGKINSSSNNIQH
jgi:hypothetical protein